LLEHFLCNAWSIHFSTVFRRLFAPLAPTRIRRFYGFVVCFPSFKYPELSSSVGAMLMQEPI
jgi:hypothetical protein